MRRTALFVAAVLGTALFLACSNNSDDGNAALLAALGGSKNSSVRKGLPANVGTNELAGKTFFNDSTPSCEIELKFGADTFTLTQTNTFPATTYNTEYKVENVKVQPYSYNSTTKQIFCKEISSMSYSNYIRDGKKFITPATKPATSAAEFLANLKTVFEKIYDLADEAYVDSQAKSLLYFMYSPYGYDDPTGNDPVPPEVFAAYNEDQELMSACLDKHVNCWSYKLSANGFTFKTDNRFPAGTSLKDIYDVFGCGSTGLQIKDGSDNAAWNFSHNPSLLSPDIKGATAGNSTVGYKVSSVNAFSINIAADATLTAPNSWSFSEPVRSFDYSTISKTDEGAVFDIDVLGRLTIEYATVDNIPDLIANEYTLLN